MGLAGCKPVSFGTCRFDSCLCNSIPDRLTVGRGVLAPEIARFESSSGSLGGLMARMLGKIHAKQCECNIEEFVSGKGEKCNHRYGVKRQRAREKREWKHEGMG